MEHLNRSYLTTLTPLRGLAALMVAVYHFEEVCAKFIPAGSTMIVWKGYLMVDLFFVLSGFIMLYVYGQNFEKSITKASFNNFLAARFARIYPLHLFTLLLLVFVFYASGAQPFPINDPVAIPTHLLLHSFGIHQIFTWNVPSWSISAEWWAYMVFPVLVALLNRYKLATRMGMLLFAAVAYLAIVYWLPRNNIFMPDAPAPQNLDVTYNYGFLRGLAGFMVGMIIYELYIKEQVRKLFGRDSNALLLIGGTALLLHLGVNDLFYIPIFAGLVLCLASNTGRVKDIFNNRPLQFLGDISYSVYLVRGLLLFWVGVPLLVVLGGYNYSGPGSLTIPLGAGILYCLLYLLISVGLSTLTYYFIEKPSRKWINRKWASSQQFPLVASR